MARRFEFNEGTSSKFWEVEVSGSTMTVRFGKIGTAGQEKPKSFATEAAAQKEADKLIAEKTGKGYVEVASGGAAPAAPAKAPSKAAAPADKKLAAVQKNVLGGRDVPKELAAMWALGKDAFFGESDFGELTLLSGESENAGHYTASADGEVWAKLFEEICWIGDEADGGIVGYFHRGSRSLDEAPVVSLDNEGCLRLTGRTLVDHFADGKDEGLEALEEFCAKAGLPKPMDEKARAASLKGLVSPEARFEELKKAAASAPKGPTSRPVDRNPSIVAYADGRVLAVSSEDDVAEHGYDANAAFLFSPATSSFVQVPETPFKAYLNLKGAGALEDGRAVLMMAGDTCRALVFDPAKNAWKQGKDLKKKQEHAAIAGLPDGKVLVAGGELYYPTKTAEVQVYDAVKDAWSTGGKLGTPRERAATALLKDGRVLIACGTVPPDDDYVSESDACDLFDPAKKTCKPTAKAPVKVAMPQAVVLDDGRVLVGGSEGCAIFDPKTEKWGKALKDDRLSIPMAKLADGRVAFFHYSHQVAVLDTAKMKLEKGGETLLPRNCYSTATTLPDGRVLLIGGDLYNNIANEPELWDPKTGKGSALPGFEKRMEKQLKDLAKKKAKK